MIGPAAELRRFLRGLLGDSVVLIRVDGNPAATGFFISEQGDICSCHHAYFPDVHGCTTIDWRGTTLPIQYVPSGSAEDRDFALFQVDRAALAERTTTPLPILDRELDSNDIFDSVITLGYAGLSDPKAPLRMRLFDGGIVGLEEYLGPRNAA